MTSRVALVGLGGRAEYYAKLIRMLPDWFELAGGCSRTATNREAFARRWQVPVFSTVEQLLDALGPVLLVTTVKQSANEHVHLQLMDYDVPLLLETPAANTKAGLDAMWRKSLTRRAPVGVAEQYIFRPLHRLMLPLIDDKLLGTPHFAHIATAHGYHATSLMRKYLGTDFAKPLSVTGYQHTDRLQHHRKLSEFKHSIGVFKFAGHRTAIVDFSDAQYHSPLRPISIKVRGECGEMENYSIAHTHADGRTLCQPVVRDEIGRDGQYLHLRGLSLGTQAHWTNPFAPARLCDDEIATALCMTSMFEPDGPAYALVDGLHDQYLALLWDSAAGAEGRSIDIDDVPWQPNPSTPPTPRKSLE